jgi:hypothetical protein
MPAERRGRLKACSTKFADVFAPVDGSLTAAVEFAGLNQAT